MSVIKKIYINSKDEGLEVQNFLFSLNYRWMNNEQNYVNVNSKCLLLIHEDKTFGLVEMVCATKYIDIPEYKLNIRKDKNEEKIIYELEKVYKIDLFYGVEIKNEYVKEKGFIIDTSFRKNKYKVLCRDRLTESNSFIFSESIEKDIHLYIYELENKGFKVFPFDNYKDFFMWLAND